MDGIYLSHHVVTSFFRVRVDLVNLRASLTSHIATSHEYKHPNSNFQLFPSPPLSTTWVSFSYGVPVDISVTEP